MVAENLLILVPCYGNILYAKHDGEVEGRWRLKKPIFLWSIAVRKELLSGRFTVNIRIVIEEFLVF